MADEPITLSISQESIQEMVRTRIRAELPFIVDLVETAIQEETRRAFTEWLTENRDAIKNAMLAAIRKDKSLPVRILASLLEHAASQYRCEIKISDVAR